MPPNSPLGLRQSDAYLTHIFVRAHAEAQLDFGPIAKQPQIANRLLAVCYVWQPSHCRALVVRREVRVLS